MSKKELVNHPAHYNIEGRKECWDEFIDKYGPECTFVWCLMTAQKYMYRKGLKDDNPVEQDLNKAQAYFNKATKIMYEFDDELEFSTTVCKLYIETCNMLSEYGKV
jgi:hypothetical protein